MRTHRIYGDPRDPEYCGGSYEEDFDYECEQADMDYEDRKCGNFD